MKDENYIVVHGWMINKFNLKANELLVYGLIFGYCQHKEYLWFDMPLSYIQKSIGASKNTVLRALQTLMELSCIKKEVEIKNNVTFVKYRHIEQPVPKWNKHPSQNGKIPGAKTEHNNTINNNTIKKDSESLFSDKEVEPISIQILNHLNKTKKSKIPFKPTRSNLKDIEARIKEKYKMKDFIAVINCKILEWKDSEKMKKYIRPSTLFGEKFGSYLDESTHTSNDGSDNFKYNPQEEAELL